MKRFLKVIDCTQPLQVRENVVGFEKALGAVKVIKDHIQYRSQSLLNLARRYFRRFVYFEHTVTYFDKIVMFSHGGGKQMDTLKFIQR